MSFPEPQRLTLTNDLAEITRLAEAVERFCEPLEPAMKDLLALQLALEESVTNVINHGYQRHPSATRTFTVELGVVGGTGAGSRPASASAVAPLPAPGSPIRIRATITDDAPAYDPLARPEVDVSLPIEERPIGGLGVHLVKKLMHHASYERRAGQNVLTLERALNAPEPV